MKSHQKRIPTPKSWKILRKITTFITRPHPGAHKIEEGMPLGVLLRDYLGYARTMREAKQILRTKNVMVDNKRRTEPKFLVGLMDVVSIHDTKEHFRIMLNNKGLLETVKIPEKEALIKPKKIIRKSKTKGGATQINFFDGTNLLVKEDSYKVGDTVVVEFPGRITQHFKLMPGMLIRLTGGKHIGEVGTVETIDKNGIAYKAKSGQYLAQKKHAFVIGEKQACITLK
jgi:small subunit ribosomal protein S4e